MERLKRLKQSILACTESQVNGNLHDVDTKQLGQAVDMIKDLEEAIYYCTIVKAMQEQDQKDIHYYTPMKNRKPMDDYWRDQRYPDMYRDYDRKMGMMYYDGPGGRSNGGNNDMGNNSNSSQSSQGNGRNYYQHNPRYVNPNDPYYPPREMRDYRQGKSPLQRKMYMEGKEIHKAKDQQMKQLQKYMQQLSKDVTQMIKDASPEQKQLLQQKMTTLVKMIGA